MDRRWLILKKLSGVYTNIIRPRAKKILIGLVIFFVLFTVVGFFVLPPILKYVLVREMSGTLHRTVTVDRIAVNPYALSITVKGLVVTERGKADTFVSCDRIFLDLESLSLFRMAPMFKEVAVTKPYIRIVRNRDLSYNFSDLLTKSNPNSKPLKFALNNITIENGSIDFADEPKQTKHTVRELGIGVPFLSNIPSYVQRFVQPRFSARIDDALYTIQGRTKPFADSLETSVDVDIKDLDIPYYLAYVPMEMKFKVLSGYVDVGAKVTFVETKEKKPSLTVSGNVALKKIALDDEKHNPFFRLPRLDVSIDCVGAACRNHPPFESIDSIARIRDQARREGSSQRPVSSACRGRATPDRSENRDPPGPVPRHRRNTPCCGKALLFRPVREGTLQNRSGPDRI